MLKRALALTIACLAVQHPAAAASARTSYAAAQARERAARDAMSKKDGDHALPKVHAAITAYRAIVRRYPTSGYSDNALWQAGCLSLDAFRQYGQAEDRALGERLLAWLQKEYPASRLGKQVDDEIASVDRAADARRARAPDREPAQPAAAAPSAGKPPDAHAVGTGGGGDDDRPIVTIRSIRRAVLPESVRVIIEMDGEVPFHEERIANPDRVFVDLPGTHVTAALRDRTIRFDGDDDLVRQVRVGRHENDTTRVVVDAASVSTYSVYALYNPYRLVIDCGRATAIAPASGPRPSTPRSFGRSGTPPALLARATAGGWAPPTPDVPPPGARLLVSAAAETVAPPPVSAPVLTASAEMPVSSPLALPPPKNLAGGFSMARQLGLGVSRIVIDPGHGGHDPGARGTDITEAQLVLDVALRLEKLLARVPGLEVILTRRTDEFVPLPDRTAIANRENADLFLSIHANASERASARGVETYFLNFAENLSAAAVAARENAASGQAMGALPDYVKAIALNNKLDESRDFAAMVQTAMVARLRGLNRAVRDLGVKQAPFVVLIGAAMPSVLAEVSFLTNPLEERLLNRDAYRQRIAEALFDAVRKYQTSLTTVTTVAHQEPPD